MQYRAVGQTGVQVSARSLGCMGLVGPDQIEGVSIATLHAEVVIASKLKDLEPVHIRRQCEESLQRLRTDCRDLHQIHWLGPGANHLALAWLLTRPGVTSVIAGAGTPERVEQNVWFAQSGLDNGTRRQLRDISEPLKAHGGRNADTWESNSQMGKSETPQLRPGVRIELNSRRRSHGNHCQDQCA